ncbi:MAG: GNAT family N-acetyltransferase [Acidimicrobiaceae bacterium]|nr:GNAT family N-acetyltransferase [Acidimicrobiaceae bacterium]
MAATGLEGAAPSTGIRPATAADLDRLIDVIWSVAAEGRWLGTQVPFDRDARRAMLEAALAAESSTILVAEAASASASESASESASAAGRGSAVIGDVTVRLAPYGVADLSMMLLDGWRGRGIGTALLDAGIEWARAAGAHKVALEVWPHNEPALRLYRRAGFVEEGRKRRHYRRANGELWDAILMGLPLS